MSDISDAEGRHRAQRIGDQMLWALWDIVRSRGDADRLFEVPGDLGSFGDGTALATVIERQIVEPAERAAAQARADLERLRADIEDRKRRVIGPHYRPNLPPTR